MKITLTIDCGELATQTNEYEIRHGWIYRNTVSSGMDQLIDAIKRDVQTFQKEFEFEYGVTLDSLKKK